MKWLKLGKVFDPREMPWVRSHAQVPTAIAIEDRIRVYFAGRNNDGKSFPAFVDVDISNPTKILNYSDKPCMDFGAPGTFDDDGMMPSEVLRDGDKIVMYYSGWNQKVKTPYHNCMGVAVSHDNGVTFERMFEGPIMDRTPLEPYVAVTPCIVKEGNQWHMWYVSGLRWKDVNGYYEPIYVIKYATSYDGISWIRPNITCIPQRHEDEAFSRPSVIVKDGFFHMWYCYRNSTDYRDGEGAYRMGYAKSKDGINWERLDEEAGITVSDSGWDSTMIGYPYVLKVGKAYYMFHNGNGFGRTGFGCAKLED